MAPVEHRIFVSHCHLDNDFGTRLAQDLRRVLADEDAVFYDVLGGLHGGERWWEKIVEELTARDVFLLILSPDAMNSSWVRREIDVALNENKSVIPLLYRICSVRADLRILQIISFLAPKTYEMAFQEVLGALGLPKAPPETPQESASHFIQPTDLTATLTQQLEEAFADHDWPNVIRKASYLIKRTSGNVPSMVYRLQGLALLEEGEVQQAQEALETALALASDRRQRLTLLSDYTALLARQDQWTKVLQQAREALRLVPNDPGWLATQQQAQSQLAQKAPVALPSQKKRQANMKGAFQPTNEYKQTWLFQANPTVWHGFHEYFKQQRVGATSDWTVSRYRKKMQPGDRVLLWEAGSRGGLLAIGELTEEPFQQEPSTKRSDEQVKPVWTVRFQYTHFLEEPIQRSTFKKTKVLQDMLHIRVPQGSNFKVTEEEWKVLQKLINQQP
jgi:tetratricopeptide (TPR) repeat protein